MQLIPRLYLMDGNTYMYRAWHAVPHMETSCGFPTNAIYGFKSIMVKLLEKERPSFMLVVFDSPGDTFRNKMYPRYKSHRAGMPEALLRQRPFIIQMLRAMGVAVFEAQNVEADDIIASLAKTFSKSYTVTIVGADKDLMQVISPSVTMMDAKTGKHTTVTDVQKRFVHPSRMVEYLALVGDSTDGVPGVKGIGPKTAKELIDKYGTLDSIYANLDKVSNSVAKRLRVGHDMAYLCRDLVQLVCDLEPIKSIKTASVVGFDHEKLATLYTDLEFSK